MEGGQRKIRRKELRGWEKEKKRRYQERNMERTGKENNDVCTLE